MTNLAEANEIGSFTVESNTIALLTKAEIDQQIATAKRYPRSLAQVRKDALAMVSLSVETAGTCIYTLPARRDDRNSDDEKKAIQGPSARFAEIMMNVWGNCRAGARTVNDQGDYVTAQGVFHDLERNAAVTFEIQRRIIDKKGRRYSVDMVGVTSNAACSIALRNAILKGIPKAVWWPIYGHACATVVGDVKSFGERRAEAMKQFELLGVRKEMIFQYLAVRGMQDIVVEHLVTLRGLLTALQEGDASVAEVFSPKATTTSSTSGSAAKGGGAATSTSPDLNAVLDSASPGDAKPKTAPAAEDPRFTAARLIRAADAIKQVSELEPLESEAKGLPEPQRTEVMQHLQAIRDDPPKPNAAQTTGDDLFAG